jgi:hypothetical protein
VLTQSIQSYKSLHFDKREKLLTYFSKGLSLTPAASAKPQIAALEFYCFINCFGFLTALNHVNQKISSRNTRVLLVYCVPPTPIASQPANSSSASNAKRNIINLLIVSESLAVRPRGSQPRRAEGEADENLRATSKSSKCLGKIFTSRTQNCLTHSFDFSQAMKMY